MFYLKLFQEKPNSYPQKRRAYNHQIKISKIKSFLSQKDVNIISERIKQVNFIFCSSMTATGTFAQPCYKIETPHIPYLLNWLTPYLKSTIQLMYVYTLHAKISSRYHSALNDYILWMTRRDIVQKPLHELLGRSNLNSVLNYAITKDDCVFQEI